MVRLHMYLTRFFIIQVVAVDFLDSDLAKIPRFQEISEVYSEELESSVVFPNTLTDKKSKGWDLAPAPFFSFSINMLL